MKKIRFITTVLIFLLFSLPLYATVINVPADESTIQAGIDAASEGDTVLVAPDTYNENLTLDKNITIASHYLITQDTSYINSTIIDGQNNNNVFQIEDVTDTNSLLSGFTIINGMATGSYGGGLYLSNSNLKLDHLKIHDNYATYDGGGIICVNSDPEISYLLIYNNTTEWNGGGICAYNGSDLTINHTTISENLAWQDGSSIACLYNSTIEINNSIIWAGTANNGVYVVDSGSMEATYSDIMNGSGQAYFGTGCIDSNPLFVNPWIGNFHLSWINKPSPEFKSPCIDKGDPDTALDPDGTRADMGVFYYAQSGIQGIVTIDGGSGDVEDVLLTAISITDTFVTNPDADGYYLLNLTPGTYDLTASLNGYISKEYEDIMVTDQLITQNITLAPPQPGYIIGKVSLSEGSGVVTQVNIAAGGTSVNPYPVTDPAGMVLYYEYTLELAPGLYNVTATLNGYYDSTQTDVTVEPSQNTTGIDFELQLIKFEGWVTGTVTLKNGSGNVQNVLIEADTVITHPEADGTYELTLINSTYDIKASLDNYTSVTQPGVVVHSDQYTEDVDFTLLNWDPVAGTQYVTTLYATTSFDGGFLEGSIPNNQMAAFGPGGTSDCRGIAQWFEGNHPLWDGFYDLNGYWYLTIVSNDNSGTELITFDAYNSDTDSIYTCNQGMFFYAEQDTSTCSNELNLSITSPLDTLEYDMISEWNWNSFNLVTADPSIGSVFSELTAGNDVYQVKNQSQASTYYDPPGAWTGDLDFINTSDGYLIYMYNPYDDFTFIGQPLNPLVNSIYLDTLWNWIGYIPLDSKPISEALASLGGMAECIKSQTQSACFDGGWFGDLTELEPQKAYKIYITPTDACKILTYPANAVNAKTNFTFPKENPADWPLLKGTSMNMIAIADIYINNKPIISNSNYTVGIIDKNGYCRSIGVRTNNIWYFTVVGNIENQDLQFVIYDKIGGDEYHSTEQIVFEMDKIIGLPKDPLTVNFTTEYDLNRPQLYCASPNPFKSNTNISFRIPTEQDVEINIYNILGQHITTLYDSKIKAGKYNIEWNGKDEKSQSVPNGIYFYKIIAGTYTQTRKMIKIK